MGVVYCATNAVNGKKYVGATLGTLEDRRRVHIKEARFGRCRLFHRAILKYGSDAFTWEVLYESSDWSDLLIHEKSFADGLSAFHPNGYNLSAGIGPGSMSDETRRKLSESKMGHVVTAEARDKISRSGIGKHSGRKRPETARRISESKKRKVVRVNDGVVFESLESAAERNGISKASVWNCCSGTRNNVYGLEFAYLDGGVSVKQKSYKKKSLPESQKNNMSKSRAGKLVGRGSRYGVADLSGESVVIIDGRART